MLNLCVSGNFYGNKTAPIAERFRFIAEMGWKEIDFDLPVPFIMQENLAAAAEEVMTQAQAQGLKIRFAHLPFSFPKKDDAEGWERFRTASLKAMEVAKQFGVDAAAIHPYSYMNPDWKNYNRRTECKNAREFLAPYCDYAHKVGLNLAIENMRGAGQFAPQYIHRFGMEVEDIVDLADDMDEGICWDTGHGNISMQAQYDSLVYIGKRLREVHLDDNCGQDDNHIAPYTGLVDWSGVAQGLREIGYKGSLNFEISCARAPEPLRPFYGKYIFESAKYIQGMVGDGE